MVRLFPLVHNKTPPKQEKFTSHMICYQSQTVNVKFKSWAGIGPALSSTNQGYTAWTPTLFLLPFLESSQLFQ